MTSALHGIAAGTRRGGPSQHGRKRKNPSNPELEKLIISRKLAHGGNPVTRWMAANVAVAQDPAGNLKPAKDKSTERIDGVVALIMAIDRAMTAKEHVRIALMAV